MINVLCLTVEKIEQPFKTAGDIAFKRTAAGDSVLTAGHIDLIVADWTPVEGSLVALGNAYPGVSFIIVAPDDQFGKIMESIDAPSLVRILRTPFHAGDFYQTLMRFIGSKRSEEQHRGTLKELKEQNDRLAGANMLLKENSSKRMEMIDAFQFLLRMFIEGTDVAEIVHESCEIAREFTASKKAYLYSCMLGEEWVGTDPVVDDRVQNALRTLRNEVNPVTVDNILIIPLWRSETYLGAFLLQAPKIDDMQLAIVRKNIVPLITIALMQQKYSEKAPEILDTIEKIISGMTDGPP